MGWGGVLNSFEKKFGALNTVWETHAVNQVGMRPGEDWSVPCIRRPCMLPSPDVWKCMSTRRSNMSV